MATATLATLIANVKMNIGGRSDKDSVITEAINNALRDITIEYDWPDLKTTDSSKTLSAAGYTVTLPAGLRKVEKVRLKDASNNYYLVDLIGKSLFIEYYSEVTPSVTGQPSHCYMEGRTIYFDKKADVNYTVYIDGYKYVDDLTASGSYPQILKLRDIIVAFATGYTFASMKQLEMANFWFAIANQKLQQRIDEMRSTIVGQLEPY